MKLRNVDPDLVDICKQIVAGVDNNPDCLPDRLIEAYSGSRQGALEHARYTVITPCDDAIQNNGYWGGKNQDGTFGLVAYDEKKGEVIITAQEARDIVAGKLKQVNVRYGKRK